VAALVDTNVLVYVYDPACPPSSAALRTSCSRPEGGWCPAGASSHRRVRRRGDAARVFRWPAVAGGTGRREAEELLATFGVLYPNDSVVRTALRGAAMYELSWFDAHMWAYAEVYGLSELWSEDFQHDRLYGTVRAVNPFL